MSDPIDKPLDYWPGGPPQGEPAPGAERAMPRPALAAKPALAVPVEFDTLLTTTSDSAAAQAVRLAVETSQIDIFESADPAAAGELRLFVKAADADRAKLIAAEVFARREKFKSFPVPTKGPVGVNETPDAWDL